MVSRLAVVCLVLAAAVHGAPADTRHAGTVVEVDPASGRLTIEEMAPGVQVRRIELRVDPTTRLLAVEREPLEVVVGESPRARDIALTYRWVERPLALSAVRAGDFAVIEVAEPAAAGEPSPARRVEVTSRAR